MNRVSNLVCLLVTSKILVGSPVCMIISFLLSFCLLTCPHPSLWWGFLFTCLGPDSRRTVAESKWRWCLHLAYISMGWRFQKIGYVLVWGLTLNWAPGVPDIGCWVNSRVISSTQDNYFHFVYFPTHKCSFTTMDRKVMNLRTMIYVVISEEG